MTLFDYYLRYMTEVWEGTRPAPEGITLPEGGDENARIQALGQQLQDMGRPPCPHLLPPRTARCFRRSCSPKAATLAVLSCFFKRG